MAEDPARAQVRAQAAEGPVVRAQAVLAEAPVEAPAEVQVEVQAEVLAAAPVVAQAAAPVAVLAAAQAVRLCPLAQNSSISLMEHFW